MAYREDPVAPPLWGLAECAWTSDAPTGPVVQDVLPDGCMDLVWTGTEVLVAGPDTGPHPYRRESGLATAGLRFSPGALPALLGVPASAVLDQRVPLAVLQPRLARRAAALLGDRPGGRPGVGSAATVLTALAVRLPGPPPGPDVRAVAAHLAAGTSAAGTADALGCTTRSLHRRCLAAFGYGPAVLRRVLRFRRASALLAAGVPIAEVAARAGYADQPHLSREVRALAGASPAAMLASGGPGPALTAPLAAILGQDGANRSTPLPSGSRTVA